jgi:hypothetical protein
MVATRKTPAKQKRTGISRQPTTSWEEAPTRPDCERQ